MCRAHKILTTSSFPDVFGQLSFMCVFKQILSYSAIAHTSQDPTSKYPAFSAKFSFILLPYKTIDDSPNVFIPTHRTHIPLLSVCTETKHCYSKFIGASF